MEKYLKRYISLMFILLVGTISYNAYHLTHALAVNANIIKEYKEELIQYNNENKKIDSNVVGIINIPKIKVQLPIINNTDKETLRYNIGQYTNTSKLGETGNAVITSNSIFPGNYLLKDINSLEKGDKVEIQNENGVYIYTVDDKIENNIPAVKSYDKNEKKRKLTIVLYEGLYKEDNKIEIIATSN